LIEQFKKSFDLSIKDYKKDIKSLHWNNFFKEKFSNLDIKDLYDFRNNHLSDGMDNVHFNDSSNLRLQQFKEFLLKNKKKIEDYYQYFPKKNIGNCPNQIQLGEGYIDFIFIEHLMMYLDLKKYIFEKNNIQNICEIGGGFGSLARLIISQSKVKYFLIDLPETNLLSAFYLNEHFKDKKIFTYEKVTNNEINEKDIAQYDIIILPPWVHLASIKIDLFINTRSMMEMNFSIINDYFKFIVKNISINGFFYNCNRYYKDTVGHPIQLHKYPYDNFWKVINSEPTWCQRRLHTLITQRSSVKTDDIKKTMLTIKNLSKNHTPHFLQQIKILRLGINLIKKILK
jgi:putative sugar O-methyltransferase